MAIQEFDRVNVPTQLDEDEILQKLREYFNPMDITEEQKEERVSVSRDLFDAMLFFFTLLSTAIKFNVIDEVYLISELRKQWSSVIEKHSKLDNYMETYLDSIAEDIVVVTLAHIDDVLASENGAESVLNGNSENYFTSNNRALLIAENEANTIMNYEDLQRAIEKGYTKKEWRTMQDRKVRDSHRHMNRKIIPIDDMFDVGTCLMYEPHDEVYGEPEELVNCRCSLKFHK